MFQLFDLKKLFEKNNIKVIEYNGWRLKTEKDIWTLAHEIFYKNGIPIVEKELISSFEKPKQRIHVKR